jgi:hypothetical protein
LNRNRTEVCLTVDTEFSIAGAFANPDLYQPLADPVVDCPADGKSQGLGFLLENLAASKTPATFFIEALQTAHFGDAPMGRVVSRIAAAGQDMQLHLHPCWLRFESSEWRQGNGADDVDYDSCAGRGDSELDRFLAVGMQAFSRWGLPRPIAMRTGGLVVDTAVHRALARARVPVSSSIGLGVHRPAESALALAGGRHWIGGTLELPVLSYKQPWRGGHGAWRALTITGCSFAEITSILWQCRRAGTSPVVILTHPFEFAKVSDFRFSRIRRNRINQRRLQKLLWFLRQHEDDFRAVSFAQGHEAWLQAPPAQSPEITTSVANNLVRQVENGLNDRVWSL